jgi:uncharacterized protein
MVLFFAKLFRRRGWAWVLWLALCSASMSGQAQVPARPEKGHYLLDLAHVLSWKGDTALDHQIAYSAKQDTCQLYVLTVPTLHEQSVEEYASQVIAQWRLPKQPATGLLLLAPREHAGYLWHSRDLNDLIIPDYERIIVNQTLLPCLHHGQDSVGLQAAVGQFYTAIYTMRSPELNSGTLESMMYWTMKRSDSPVHDLAYLFTPREQAALKREAASYMAQDSSKVIIVTVATLCGLNLEKYARDICRVSTLDGEPACRYGGVLILLAEQERRMHIMTLFSSILTDTQAKAIIDSTLTPALQKQQYYAGIHQVFGQLHRLKLLNINAARNSEKWSRRLPWLLIGGFLLLVFSLPFWARNLRGHFRPAYQGYSFWDSNDSGRSGSGSSGGSSFGGDSSASNSSDSSSGGGASGSW